MSNGTDRWAILRRGKADWNADGVDSMGNKVSGSGGTLEHYLLECEDGTPVYDAKEADYDSFAEFVVCGPMVDVTLKLGEVKRFNDHSTLARMMPGLEGAFKALGAMALVDELRAFDSVSLDVYLDMLKAAVPGVKIGKVVAHQIEWLPEAKLNSLSLPR